MNLFSISSDHSHSVMPSAAIRVGFFDRNRNCFFHPTNGRRLNLDAACKENLIQSTKSIVKHLSRVQANAEATREFVSDVIAHQTDLRFITMAVQKFVDESMEYLVVLNYFRDRLPQRMRRIEPSELLVQDEVVEVTEDYQVFNCLLLSQGLPGYCDQSQSLLKEVEPKATKIVNEPLGAEPITWSKITLVVPKPLIMTSLRTKDCSITPFRRRLVC
jgi:hypothetical protein